MQSGLATLCPHDNGKPQLVQSHISFSTILKANTLQIMCYLLTIMLVYAKPYTTITIHFLTFNATSTAFSAHKRALSISAVTVKQVYCTSKQARYVLNTASYILGPVAIRDIDTLRIGFQLTVITTI